MSALEARAPGAATDQAALLAVKGLQGALLLAALCERDRACPRFTRMQLHNHLSMVYQFNTADDALGREIAEFIRRGR